MSCSSSLDSFNANHYRHGWHSNICSQLFLILLHLLVSFPPHVCAFCRQQGKQGIIAFWTGVPNLDFSSIIAPFSQNDVQTFFFLAFCALRNFPLLKFLSLELAFSVLSGAAIYTDNNMVLRRIKEIVEAPACLLLKQHLHP